MKLAKHFLPAAAVFAISAAFTSYWYRQPNSFPDALSGLGNWIIDALGIHTADASADAEAVYVALVSLLLALLLVCALMIVRHLWRTGIDSATTRRDPSLRR